MRGKVIYQFLGKIKDEVFKMTFYIEAHTSFYFVTLFVVVVDLAIGD